MTPASDCDRSRRDQAGRSPTTHFGLGAGSTIPLDVEGRRLATGAQLLVDDEGGATTLVTVTAVATTSQSARRPDRHGHGAHRDAGDPGDRRPAHGDGLRARRPGDPVLGLRVPRAAHAAAPSSSPAGSSTPTTIEVGRTIVQRRVPARRRLAARGRLAGPDGARRRRGDRPVAGTVESAATRRLDGVLRADAARTRRACASSGSTRFRDACSSPRVGGPLPSSFALVERRRRRSSSASATVGPRTLTLAGAVTTLVAAAGRARGRAARRGHRAGARGGPRLLAQRPPVVVPGRKGGEVVFTRHRRRQHDRARARPRPRARADDARRSARRRCRRRSRSRARRPSSR